MGDWWLSEKFMRFMLLSHDINAYQGTYGKTSGKLCVRFALKILIENEYSVFQSNCSKAPYSIFNSKLKL